MVVRYSLAIRPICGSMPRTASFRSLAQFFSCVMEVVWMWEEETGIRPPSKHGPEKPRLSTTTSIVA